LVIAAHPDDEDTTLLTWVTRGLGGEAAYLSLSRGDGGQNLIGPELGQGLGLLRSRELEAARRIDGARQFFSRAFDFGYTRSLEETLERWPKEILLEDAVRVVRRFKPQVLMAVFPPTAQAGHGQHQASALVAEEVFELAADPEAFPHLLDLGLAPWRINTFYRGAFFAPENASLEIPLGRIDAMSGRSILQIALESRSQHRCQDMGMLQPLGDFNSRLTWVAGIAEEGLFDGTATELAAIADLLPAGLVKKQLATDLARVAALASAARRDLDPTDPTGAVPNLKEIVVTLNNAARSLVTASALSKGPSGIDHARELVNEKLEVAQGALAIAAQVLVDAVSERAEVVPGETLDVHAILWNAGPHTVTNLTLELLSEEGWEIVGTEPPPQGRARFATRVTEERVLTLKIPKTTKATVPYFLRRSRIADLYDWRGAHSANYGEPFQPPPAFIRFLFTLDGVPMELDREVVQRVRDQAFGEVRRPLRTVPKLEVQVDPPLIVWPLGTRSLETLSVKLSSNVKQAQTAQLEITPPAGWPAVAPVEVEIQPLGRVTAEVPLTAPADLAPGRYEILVAAIAKDGSRYDMAYPLIDYEHVRPTPLPIPARVTISAGDIRLPVLERLGFVRGASDQVPDFLRRIGLPVVLLSDDELAAGDLSSYQAIVIGSRAYEVNPALSRANGRLLDYVRSGGLLLVQYQQYQFVRGDFAPFPLSIDRPHDRVTDETADVLLLDPEHPAMTTPNLLGPDDWQGWVQERGLYFADTWDEAYHPLLAMADPGGEEQHGALLVAPLGKGTYIYTGMAFFRQLPAGVPGAYRLFANLLALANPEEITP
jgi:LmbE family N-acetylglucosaminyl deacetylase